MSRDPSFKQLVVNVVRMTIARTGQEGFEYQVMVWVPANVFPANGASFVFVDAHGGALVQGVALSPVYGSDGTVRFRLVMRSDDDNRSRREIEAALRSLPGLEGITRIK